MFKALRRILYLVVLAVVVFFVVKGMTKVNVSLFGNHNYYQRSKGTSTNDGLVNRKTYSQAKLKQLTTITHGSKYSGNTSLDKVATSYSYKMAGRTINNFMGRDGVLQLYNESSFMSDKMVKDAAEYWNNLAGAQIVEVVKTAKASDEVIHDSQEQNKYGIGGQTYNNMGMLFYPRNWAVTGLTTRGKNNWKEAILLREIGHALGIPNLGGGAAGNNDRVANEKSVDFMGNWGVELANAPIENQHGITSTPVDAAALTIAGIAWLRPQKLANWVFTTPKATVKYNNGKIVSTIPKS
ncbi:zinc metalloprotease [Levilactobacillus fujinensis]|uniref:Peptidase M10 metallopeptidase domain-containing protein n=1 Tax=Levilactobacillus fujinensis TaxID=2486024 RepID=A0ABW1TI55_9LACO|nr:hypothetical protein [Levilactobacillus fujinensis]